MYMSAFKAFCDCDVRHIKLPRYKTDFLGIKNVICYKSFRVHVIELNPFPITRKQMETSWIKLLFKSFKRWNPDTAAVIVSEQVDTSYEQWKHRILTDAMSQVRLNISTNTIPSWLTPE